MGGSKMAVTVTRDVRDELSVMGMSLRIFLGEPHLEDVRGAVELHSRLGGADHT